MTLRYTLIDPTGQEVMHKSMPIVLSERDVENGWTVREEK